MKLLFFDDWRHGILKGDQVIDVSPTVRDIPHVGPPDLMNGLIARFPQYRHLLDEAADRGRGVPLAAVPIRPPLPRPVNIVCMAVNYP